MENKYYTSSIEEFHVGFEYYLLTLSDEGIEHDYLKMVWNADCNMEDMFDVSYINGVKIVSVPEVLKCKYLDREDIKSLGWEHDGKKSYTLNCFDLGDRWCLIWYPNNRRVEIYDEENENGFLGTIKNKSELKKLMQQLGITQLNQEK